MHKISICTVSMNRIFHVRETLPTNIIDNHGYKNIEFVLLDYNSTDGLGEWVKNNMGEHIKSGLLKYYKTTTPNYFDRSHSRNLVSNLATGDIIALIDADNYTGKDYAEWISNKFVSEGESSIITCIDSNNLIFRDQGGKCAFHKNYFKASRGFDESMHGYGFEDVDFIRRLIQVGGKRVLFERTEEEFFRFIGHSNIERICNEKLLKNISAIYHCMYENEEDHKKQCVLYLFEDNSFMTVAYTFDSKRKNIYQSHEGWNISDNGRLLGNYVWSQSLLKTKSLGHDDKTWSMKDGYLDEILLDDNGMEWNLVPLDMDDYSIYLLLYTECWNRAVYYSNIDTEKIINPSGWGKGNVSLNFGDVVSFVHS